MRRRLHAARLADVFQRIREQEELPMEFSSEAREEAEKQAAGGALDGADMRDVPFVTIDPPDAMDLDQAMAFEELAGDRLRLRYAIADVPAFVTPGGALDAEARRRGTTVYCPDHRVSLHPVVLSEGAASLLPDVDRPALVWEIDVDGDGEIQRHDLRRSVIRSRQRFDYQTVQEMFDAGNPPEPIAALRRFGEVRIARGVERGALTLRLPEQEVEQDGGKWHIVNREARRAELWNAEVSLLTGMVAAGMMIERGTGILRTLPAPTSQMLGDLRAAARALGIAWSADQRPADVLVDLDPARPRQMALFERATELLRGAGYVSFVDGIPDGDLQHGGLATVYAHVTAPLRRLVDRFGLAVCLAVAGDQPVPDWVTADIESIPEMVAVTDQRAGTVESRCINAVEAWIMAERLHETFQAVVLSENGGGAEVWIDDPPILARAPGLRAKPGSVVELTVTEADVERGRIALQPAP